MPVRFFNAPPARVGIFTGLNSPAAFARRTGGVAHGPTRSGVVYQSAPFNVCSGKRVGLGVLAATTKKLVGTEQVPVSRQVVLIDMDRLQLVGLTRSNAEGHYAFSGVPLDARYIVASIDHTGQFRIAAADNLTAELP